MSKKEETKKESKTQQRHDSYVEHFRKAIVVDGKEITVNEDVISGVLPENLKAETFKQVDEFRTSIVPPLVQVMGERSLELMKDNDDVEDVLETIDVYGQQLTVQVNRNAKEGSERIQASYTSNFEDVQNEYDAVCEAIHTAYNNTFTK